MSTIPANLSPAKIFGENVFGERVMQQRLPSWIYESLMKTIREGASLDPEVAMVVAAAMKDWAIEKGATHYTHWFQPMTGITAEKHDSFICPQADGQVILEFSGKELIKGEPDASSFPSGGLRATFEARGYTAWDPTSYAFVKDGALCIPTAFCSYSGEVLDKKTPLLRSMEAVNRQAVRLLGLLGKPAKRVTATVGAEQEYFLIDRELYLQRKDLVLAGRTLFGAKPPKGQELDDHYFGSMKERVMLFMQELDAELWKLGVYAKTRHNEVAPAQHELAPVYTTTNIATDHNQLTMELMKKIAARHGLACLLSEKPFAGVNGSGKHNNWSLSTDTGENLLSPGENPAENKPFLLFMAAVLKAVDQYAGLLRVSVAIAGNDYRLGAHEAPPAIVSVFLGEQLTQILGGVQQQASPLPGTLQTGVAGLPVLSKDTSDRNRTSPFAFTGNKFEFRMPGSSQSIAGINIVINTIVADTLACFANRLEAAQDKAAEADAIVRDTMRDHGRIIYNGNNYEAEWVQEALRRGLPNLSNTVDALKEFVRPESIALFLRHGIFTENEVRSRCEIMLDDYSKIKNIEARTMLEMAKREILPACIAYSKLVFEALAAKQASGLRLPLEREQQAARQLAERIDTLMACIDALQQAREAVKQIHQPLERAQAFRDSVVPAMESLRSVADQLEATVDAGYWPFPTYSQLLFYV